MADYYVVFTDAKRIDAVFMSSPRITLRPITEAIKVV